jgi:hypothetical protein
MKKNLFSIFLLPLLFAACSNDETLLDDPNAKEETGVYNSLLDMTIKKSQNVLEFKDESAFKQTVKKLNEAQTSYRKVDGIEVLAHSDISFKADGFNSIFDDYVDAMNEAENYCDTEEGYYQFKEKYSNLYFPEEGDDYSAYLPVSDKTVAKLLNSKGEVLIGGVRVNMIDINSYEQLTTMGLTPQDESTQSLLRSNTCRTSADIYNGKRDRKMWIKADYTYNQVHIEVSFRKKGAFGIWYNYSSSSNIAGITYCYNSISMLPSNATGFIPWIEPKNESSSHDYYALVDNNVVQRINGTVYINHQGFEDINPIAFGVDLTRN